MLLYSKVVVPGKLGGKIAGGCDGKMAAFFAEDVLRVLVLNIDLNKPLSPGTTLIQGRSRGWNGELLCCSIQSRTLRFLKNKAVFMHLS